MKIPFSRTLNQLAFGTYRTIQLRNSQWTFSKYRANMYALEYNDWLKYYLPKEGVKNKIILDIGAGEGETAKFYLDQGAKFVLCIEPDEEAWRNLNQNVTYHNISIQKKPFTLSDIEEAYSHTDLIKLDIEGYEEELLLHPHPKTPIIAEIHGLQLADKFRKADYYIVTPSKYGCLSYAYWKCKPHGN